MISNKLFEIRAENLLKNSNQISNNSKLVGYLLGIELSGSRTYWEDKELVIFADRTIYNTNELMDISGSGARQSATVTIKIFDSENVKISELNITAKNNGEYLTIWKIPADMESGEYTLTADDGASNTSTKFTIS